MPDEFLVQSRAQMAAKEAQTMAAAAAAGREAGWWIPPLCAFIITACFWALIIKFNQPTGGPAKTAELDRKHLDCRMMGQSWEHFGSLGWQCVPAEVKP